MSLSIWAIYQPNAGSTAFRVCHWQAAGDELRLLDEDKYLGASLEALRQQFAAMGLVRMARDDADDPTLIETWL